MLGVRVEKRHAEETRRRLASLGVLDREHKAVQEGGYVIFPVTRPVEGYDVVEREFPPAQKKPRSIEEYLRPYLTEDEMKRLVKSFDIVGHVAIIEIPPELLPKKHIIGEAILAVHPNVRTVVREVGKHEGVYRVQPVEVIAGEPNLVTTYREHGAVMRLEVGKTYFSPRLSYERLRIARLVRPGEVVGALFAGVGPFPLVIYKKQPAVKRIYAVEINPDAYKYLVENIRLNRAEGKIIPFLGDVRDVVPREFPHECDRVLMPLPKGAEHFLDVAFTALKPSGGYIHFYQFAPEEDLYSRAERLVQEKARELGWRVKIVGRRKVRPHAPHIYQIVLDIWAERQRNQGGTK